MYAGIGASGLEKKGTAAGKILAAGPVSGTDQAKKAGKKDFSIPFDRQELADYLCVDRSAMSAELGKLKREGKIDFWKNEFRLLS